jgi:hypothetical protein
MKLEESIARVEEILGSSRGALGDDFRAYRNHVYRVIHYCFALQECHSDDREKVLIAASFHDLGIWTDRTFDYLQPSIALANEYLSANELTQWTTEIGCMIEWHHKVRRHHDDANPLIETFRKSDLVDVSWGLVSCGIPAADLKRIQNAFPNGGFHKRLVKLAAAWVLRHPFSPLPIVKW